MGFIVDATYVKSKILPTLIGTGARYAGVVDDTTLGDFVAMAAAEVQQRLSTRFSVTTFKGWLGPGVRPANTAPVVGDPAANPPVLPVEGIEYEPPYQWPNISPSLGFLNWRFRVRPVVELVGGYLQLPGSYAPGLELQPDWFRLNFYSSEGTLMPSYGAAALVLPNLPFGLFNWMHQRIPEAVLFNYRAGMTDAEWALFPQINRLVGLRAGLRALPALSMKINPGGLTSQSADGLSQSRSSGYVFKDLEERLKGEADDIQSQVLDAWDGTTALNIL